MINASTIDRIEAVIQQAERELEAIAFELDTKDAEKLGALIDDIATARCDHITDRRDDMTTTTITTATTGQTTEFAGCLYSCPAFAQIECVKAWLTGCGNNADSDVIEYLDENTDEELLAELTRSGWSFPVGTDLEDAQAAVESARIGVIEDIG